MALERFEVPCELDADEAFEPPPSVETPLPLAAAAFDEAESVAADASEVAAAEVGARESVAMTSFWSVTPEVLSSAFA